MCEQWEMQCQMCSFTTQGATDHAFALSMQYVSKIRAVLKNRQKWVCMVHSMNPLFSCTNAVFLPCKHSSWLTAAVIKIDIQYIYIYMFKLIAKYKLSYAALYHTWNRPVYHYLLFLFRAALQPYISSIIQLNKVKRETSQFEFKRVRKRVKKKATQ